MTRSNQLASSFKSEQSSRKMQKRKILVIRLSSLGDVILSSAVWQGEDSVEFHFLTDVSVAELFRQDPKLAKVWTFDRKEGFEAWKRLVNQLLQENFDEVWDLHRSLRSTWFWMISKKTQPKLRWKRFQKQKWRAWGQAGFKMFWPKRWQPQLRVNHYLKTVGQPLHLRPKIYLPKQTVGPTFDWAIMPSSKWFGKTLPVGPVSEWIASLKNQTVVVLGTPHDQPSVALVKALKKQSISFEDQVTSQSLLSVAQTLKNSKRYFGADTGLAHLAEAVGTPATIVFGPPGKNGAFQPWRSESQAVQRGLGCQPCGKDGRTCIRVWDRHACTQKLELSEIQRFLSARDTKAQAHIRTPRSGWRIQVYRWIANQVTRNLRSSRHHQNQEFQLRLPNVIQKSAIHSVESHFWFHGASAGECEALFAVIERLFEKAQAENQSIVFSLTTLSPSGLSAIRRFINQHPEMEGSFLRLGLSPLEGQWKQALCEYPVNVMVGVKYEAWPELWASLSECQIPLYLLNTGDRRSLRWNRRLLGLLGVELPELALELQDEGDADVLRSQFPQAKIIQGADPRWDRIFARSRNRQNRIEALKLEFSHLPKPWGVLGSLWSQDLEVLTKAVAELDQGTLWIAPHLMRSSELTTMVKALRGIGRPVFFTHPEKGVFENPKEPNLTPKKAVVMVNEMGILAELYSLADWAFVGGGFTRNGVHNTMEPAVYGIPISAGPKNAQKFFEIHWLKTRRQLTLIHRAEEFSAWIRRWNKERDPKVQSKWQDQLRVFEGASQKAAKRLWNYI